MPKMLGLPEQVPYFAVVRPDARVRVSWRARTRSVLIEFTDAEGGLTVNLTDEVGGDLVRAISALLVKHAEEPPDPAITIVCAFSRPSDVDSDSPEVG